MKNIKSPPELCDRKISQGVMDKWIMQRKRNLQVSLMAVLHSRTKDFPLPVKVFYYNMSTPVCDLKAGTQCLLLISFTCANTQDDVLSLRKPEHGISLRVTKDPRETTVLGVECFP